MPLYADFFYCKGIVCFLQVALENFPKNLVPVLSKANMTKAAASDGN